MNLFRGVLVLLLLFTIAVFIPIAGSILLLFTPLPVLYYGIKIGRMKGIAVTVVALSLMTAIVIVLGIKVNILVLYLFSALGLILSEALRRGYAIEKIILYPAVILSLTSLVILLYEGQQSAKQPLELIEFYVAGHIHETISIYKNWGLPPEQINLIRDNAGRIAHFFTRIYPALILVAISFTAWLNVLTARYLFEKGAVPYPSLGDLACWKAPEATVWFLIAGGLIAFAAPGDYVFIGLNLLIICSFLYLMQGLSIISFLFKRKKVPPVLRIVLYFLIFAQQYILLIVIAIGLFDLWVNFRKYIKPINDAAVS